MNECSNMYMQAVDFKKQEVHLYIPLCKHDNEAKSAAEQIKYACMQAELV